MRFEGITPDDVVYSIGDYYCEDFLDKFYTYYGPRQTVMRFSGKPDSHFWKAIHHFPYLKEFTFSAFDCRDIPSSLSPSDVLELLPVGLTKLELRGRWFSYEMFGGWFMRLNGTYVSLVLG